MTLWVTSEEHDLSVSGQLLPKGGSAGVPVGRVRANNALFARRKKTSAFFAVGVKSAINRTRPRSTAHHSADR
jgi:hypothetical protein